MLTSISMCHINSHLPKMRTSSHSSAPLRPHSFILFLYLCKIFQLTCLYVLMLESFVLSSHLSQSKLLSCTLLLNFMVSSLLSDTNFLSHWIIIPSFLKHMSNLTSHENDPFLDTCPFCISGPSQRH